MQTADYLQLIELAAEATAKIWSAVEEAKKSGKVDASQISDALQTVIDRTKSINSTIDQEIDQKFGG